MSAAGKMRDAVQAGRDAQDAREPRSSCPHNPAGATAEQRVLATMWRRGWDDQNPMPILDGSDGTPVKRAEAPAMT